MDDEGKHSVTEPCSKAQKLDENSALQTKEQEKMQPLGDPEDQGRQDLESPIGEKRKRCSESDVIPVVQNSALQEKEETVQWSRIQRCSEHEKIQALTDQEDQGSQGLDSSVIEKGECFSESEEIPGIRVPLLSREEASWRKFQEFDKGNPILTCFSIDGNGIKEQKTIDLDHPIVPMLLRFAIKSFSEICEQAGRSNRIQFLDIVKVDYISLSFGYVYYITFEGCEDETNGVYEAKVVINRHNGRKTLVMLVRTLRPPIGKKNEKLCAECFDLDLKHGMRAEKEPVNQPINVVAAEGLRPRNEQQTSFDYANPVKGFEYFVC